MDRIQSILEERDAAPLPHVYLLRPPYREPLSHCDELGPPYVCGGVNLAPPRGSIAALRVQSQTPWPTIISWVATLQRRLATCPVVIWADGVPVDRIAAFAYRMRMIGVRACLSRPTVDLDLLREVLCDVLAFPADLTRWLDNRGFELTPRAREQLEIMACHALDHSVFHQFLRATQQEDGSLRSEFEKSGLGAPGKWFHLLRTVRAAMAIQAEPELLVSKLAQQFGFYDPAHLRRRLDDVIGANPSAIHHHMSWEWMLFVALRRAGISLPVDRESMLAAAQ